MTIKTGATWIKQLAGVVGAASASIFLQLPVAAESVAADSISQDTPSGEVADATEMSSESTIVEIAASSDSFTILTAALEAAGLLDVLSGEGAFYGLRTDR